MQIKCLYVNPHSQDRKHPFDLGKVYHIVIRGNQVFNELHMFDSPEMTIEEFLTEFLPLKPGD